MRIIIITNLAILILFLGCQNSNSNKDVLNREEITNISEKTAPDNKVNEQVILDKIDTIKVLILQCYNSYDFASYGYNFNPVIEDELNKFVDIEVIPFPYKKLKNIPYQGIYDKKYCKPILDRVEADFYIMTRFVGPHPDTPFLDSTTWGYEIKILNTETMNQKVSIGKIKMKEYRDIKIDIGKNIEHLYNDIKELKKNGTQ